LKWAGLSDKHNSWKLLEDINCPEIVDIFEKNLAEQKTKYKLKKKYSHSPLLIILFPKNYRYGNLH